MPKSRKRTNKNALPKGQCAVPLHEKTSAEERSGRWILFAPFVSVGKSEQIIGRNVKIARRLGNIRSGRVALVCFPIADDAQAYAQISCNRRLRQASFFSQLHEPFCKYFHNIIIHSKDKICKSFIILFLQNITFIKKKFSNVVLSSHFGADFHD